MNHIPLISMLLSVPLILSEFEMYDPLPPTGVAYKTSDAALEALLVQGELLESGNAHEFYKPKPPLPEPFEVLVEGSTYNAAFLETQPMAGAMYATRSVRLAVDNQLVFMRTQRSDGKFPARVNCGRSSPWQSPKCDPDASLPGVEIDVVILSGFYMAAPAVDVAWFMALQPGSKANAYMDEVAQSLQRFDDYLWSIRNDSTCAGLLSGVINPASCPPTPSNHPGNNRGLLWSVGSGDTGEDGTDKYVNNTGPIQSMDMMGYSYSIRHSLSRIARLRGDSAEAKHWTMLAQAVANTTIRNLWREEFGAMYDRDAKDEWVTTLVHNNLRMMWLGLFTQDMADMFVARHLMNQSEFWTKMPLPSIAVNDYRFHCKPKALNDWSGAVEGLTIQRAIRALESYGHFAELTLVGRALTIALLNGCTTGTSKCHYPQQIDPITGIPFHGGIPFYGDYDGYGPMILSLLEYTALRVGITPRAQLGRVGSAFDEGGLLWNGIADGEATTQYNQTLGNKIFTLHSDSHSFVGMLNGKRLFECTEGVRVVTTLTGTLVAVVGIADVAHAVTIILADGARIELTVKPNEVWGITSSRGSVLRPSARFIAPHSPPNHDSSRVASSTIMILIIATVGGGSIVFIIFLRKCRLAALRRYRLSTPASDDHLQIVLAS